MYTYNARVRFSESGADGKLRFQSLLNYLQDCSTFHSEDLGIGVSFLREKNLVWVINYWQIDIISYPNYGDRIVIGTAPYDFKSFLGYRNFFIKDSNGHYLCKATSIWTLLSTENGKPVRPKEEDIKPYGVDEKLDMEYLPRKIFIPEKVEKMESVEIKKYHLDTNNHVNNGKYVEIASEFVDNFTEAKRIRVEYRKQAYLGDMLTPYVGKTEDGAFVVKLTNSEDEAVCVVELS